MDEYLIELVKAFVLFIKCSILYVSYYATRRSVQNAPLDQPLWLTLSLPVLAIIIISSISAFQLGTHIESNDDDPIYGSSSVVQDFEPLMKERVKTGIRIFTTLILPSLYGMWMGYNRYSSEFDRNK